MGIWRPNVWSNFDEIWYRAANLELNGSHVIKYEYNSPTRRPIWTKLWWSHAIIFLTCPPWCGCHSNGCCLATAHWTSISYGRLEAESVNILMKFYTQQQIWNAVTVTWPNMIFFKIQDGFLSAWIKTNAQYICSEIWVIKWHRKCQHGYRKTVAVDC